MAATMTTSSASEAVKVESGKLMCCLTCPLCNDLFIDATTISECLHTFCRDCIYEKINEDELQSCPVCNAYLGGVPLEKLRADHTMDDLREKIFPCKRRKENAPETTESSLSSLTTKEVSIASPSATKTISKYTAQENIAAARQSSTSVIAHGELLSVQNKQNNTQVMEKETDNSNKKEATVTSSYDSNIHDTLAKPEPIQIDETYCNVQEHGHMPIIERVEKSGQIFGTLGSVQHGNLQHVLRGKTLANGCYEQARVDVDADRRRDKLTNPIWFALVASDHQEGNEPLPQISSNYLRVRDGNITVSLIQKYLVKKLGLTSEIEVEISLKGQPVSSTLHLHDIVELWQHTTTKAERIQVSAGGTAMDFVMVLSYGRKSCQPGNFPNVCTHLKKKVQQEIK